jgi:hypothetical protein
LGDSWRAYLERAERLRQTYGRRCRSRGHGSSLGCRSVATTTRTPRPGPPLPAQTGRLELAGLLRFANVVGRPAAPTASSLARRSAQHSIVRFTQPPKLADQAGDAAFELCLVGHVEPEPGAHPKARVAGLTDDRQQAALALLKAQMLG